MLKVKILGFFTLFALCLGPAMSSNIQHSGTVNVGSKITVSGSFSYAPGYTPSVEVEYGNLSSLGIFSSLTQVVTRAGNLQVNGMTYTGTFTSNFYQGTAGVTVAYKNTLKEYMFFTGNRVTAFAVGTITP